MAILTKAAVTKGSPASFTLNVQELLGLPGITEYYQNYQNISHVNFIFGSNPGNQKKVVSFNLRLADDITSVPGVFSVSDQALDVFEIKAIVLIDYDGGFCRILRSSLTTADFDVDMTPSTPISFTLDLSEVEPVTYYVIYKNRDAAALPDPVPGTQLGNFTGGGSHVIGLVSTDTLTIYVNFDDPNTTLFTQWELDGVLYGQPFDRETGEASIFVSGADLLALNGKTLFPRYSQPS